jgi:hypothetical protein
MHKSYAYNLVTFQKKVTEIFFLAKNEKLWDCSSFAGFEASERPQKWNWAL